jgi:CBS domain-containing protein
MNAKDVMRRQVAAVRAEDSLARTAALMRDRGCGAVVVVQAAGNRPVAMVTDRDICMAALRTNKPLSDLAVASAMSPALHVAAPDEPVAALASRMGLHQIRRLPVVDAAGALVGIVALDDLAQEARRQDDLRAPSLPAASDGKALGEVARPHLDLPATGLPATGLPANSLPATSGERPRASARSHPRSSEAGL